MVWLVLASDLVLSETVFHLSDQWGRVLIGLAMVGSMTMIVERFQRPCEEIFDAGREYQRRVDMRERNRHVSIFPIRRIKQSLLEPRAPAERR